MRRRLTIRFIQGLQNFSASRSCANAVAAAAVAEQSYTRAFDHKRRRQVFVRSQTGVINLDQLRASIGTPIWWLLSLQKHLPAKMTHEADQSTVARCLLLQWAAMNVLIFLGGLILLVVGGEFVVKRPSGFEIIRGNAVAMLRN